MIVNIKRIDKHVVSRLRVWLIINHASHTCVASFKTMKEAMSYVSDNGMILNPDA